MSIGRGIFLDLINAVVASNIKRLREEKKLSMEELAKLSGVSKSMIAQIERGEGNPTLSTLWKLSNGMKVPFDTLTIRTEAQHEIVRISEVQPLLENEGNVRNYSLFPDNENRRFAIYYLELEKDSYWQSQAHLHGTIEFITLLSGIVKIEVNEKEFIIKKGDSIRFHADTIHSYQNIGDEMACMHMTIYNP